MISKIRWNREKKVTVAIKLKDRGEVQKQKSHPKVALCIITKGGSPLL